MAAEKKCSTLQEVARNIGVLYYSYFKVIETQGLNFPMAEVYERGKWRKLVIGGRPYREESVARTTIKDAKMCQKKFLEAMTEEGANELGSHITGLTNPIDHWGYDLEL